jgi:hypothetical protein
MRTRAAVVLALAVGGCAGTDTAPRYQDPYALDYGFRYGIYDYHYGDDDIDIDRPDRPRPPPGYDRPRPSNPIAQPPTAGGNYGRGMGARSGGGFGGGGRGGGGGRR